MIHGSAAFEAAVTAPHEVAATAYAYTNKQRVGGPFRVVAASVSDTAGQFARRTGTVTLAGADAVDYFTRPATLLRLSAGANVGGRPATVPVLFGVSRTPRIDDAAGTITLQVSDLGQRVMDDQFAVPRQSIKGATVPQQIQALVQDSLPFVQFVDMTGDTTAVPATSWTSRTDAITQLAISIGAETFARPDGTWVLQYVKDWRTTPDLVVQDKVNLVQIARSIDFSKSYNYVIATSQRADGTTILATSQDNDPASPLYVESVGRIVGTVQSGLYVTQAQAQAAAYAGRMRCAGYPAALDLSAVLHPGLSSSDRLWVRHTDQITGKRGSYQIIVDSLSYDVLGASMQITGRSATQPPSGVS